jgi:hypothetical protein
MDSNFYMPVIVTQNGRIDTNLVAEKHFNNNIGKI